jgi:hypothetical protein
LAWLGLVRWVYVPGRTRGVKIIRGGVMMTGMGRKDLGDSVSRGWPGALRSRAGREGAGGPGTWNAGTLGGSAGVLGMLC